ncbi:MAG: ATP-binding protein, partial [archaeon]
PGTGKTLLAKAVANEAESHFISIKGPELFNKYVGETERGIRDVFSTARETAPTVIFFDEIDAIGSERRRESHDSKVTERVVSQLLTELDGLEELGDVVVIAATNRPDMIDYALMRPGRLDRHVQMGAPKETARREIFEIHTRGRPLAADVDLDELATQTNGFVGADIESICREAATNAVRGYIMASNQGESVAVEEIELTMDHFEQAIVGVDDRSDDSEQRTTPRAERESVDSTVE